jgi:hypothetical protein
MCSPDVSAVGLEGVRLGAQLHELHLLLPFSLLPLAGRPAAIKGGFQWREGGRKEGANDAVACERWDIINSSDSLSLSPTSAIGTARNSLSHTHTPCYSLVLRSAKAAPLLACCSANTVISTVSLSVPSLDCAFFTLPLWLCASFSPTTFRRSDKANLCGSAYTTISRVNSVSGCVWLFFTDFLLVYHRASFRVRAGEGSGRRHP